MLNLPKLDTPSKERLLFVFRLTRETDDSSLQGKAIYPRQSPLSTDSYSFIATARYNKTTSSGLFNNQGASGETSSSSSARFDSYEFLNPNPYSSGFELNFDSFSLDSFALNNIDNEMLYANMPIFTQRLHAKLLQELYAPVEPQTAGLKFAGILPPSEFIERNSIDFEKNSSSAIIDNFLFSPSAMSPDIFFRPLLRNPFDATLPWEVRINPYNLIHYLQPSPTQTFFANQFSLITNFWGNQLHNAATFLRNQYEDAKAGAINLASNVYREVGVIKLLADPVDILWSGGVLFFGALSSVPAAIYDYLYVPAGIPAVGVARGNTDVVFANGFGNSYPKGQVPDYAKNYINDINASTSLNAIAVAAYENSPGKIGYAKNFCAWLPNAFGGKGGARDIRDKINTATYNGMELSPHSVFIAYSGGRNYAHKVLEMMDYGFETAILVAPPSLEGYITKGVIDNSNIKRVISVRGENDSVALIGDNYFEGVDNINIEIRGADHYNLFRNPEGSYKNPGDVKFNKMAGNFMVRLAEAAHRGKNKLDALLTLEGIRQSSITKTYTVDLNKLFKEQ